MPRAAWLSTRVALRCLSASATSSPYVPEMFCSSPIVPLHSGCGRSWRGSSDAGGAISRSPTVSDIAPTCDRFVKWGLVSLLVFTPFAFGTVESWSIAFMEWGIVALFLICALGWFWPGARTQSRPRRLTGMEIPIVMFLAFCALQTVPLPGSWLKRISPGSARMYQSVDLTNWQGSSEIGKDANDREVSLLQLSQAERRPISLQPQVTWDRIQMLAALGLSFLLVAFWADRADRIVFLLGTVATVGFLVAMQGLVQRLTWNGKVLWFRRVPPSSPFGPFVNHNHFAGYVEMIIPVAIGLTLFLADTRRPAGTPPSGRESL